MLVVPIHHDLLLEVVVHNRLLALLVRAVGLTVPVGDPILLHLLFVLVGSLLREAVAGLLNRLSVSFLRLTSA